MMAASIWTTRLMTIKKALTYALLAFTGLGGTITFGKPGRGSWTRRTDMAAEIHIWQPASGGDALADASWDTLAPAGQATEFGTFSGVPLNLDTVAINANGHVTPGSDKTYTFKTTLTPAANEVLIGADAAECARNLVSAIMADGNTDRYGDGTVAHDAVTAILSGNDVQLTSVHYGTDPNDIVLAESASNFVWDGAAVNLSGGVTTWTTGDAEIVLNGDNHSAVTSNLDWPTLLSPSILIGKFTKKEDNHSAIGSSGTPWVIESKASRFVNLMGSGVIYYEAYDGSSAAPTVIVSGPEHVILTGEIEDLHLTGSCFVECSADFDSSGTVGTGGSIVTVSSAFAVLEIKDSSLENPYLIEVKSGRVTNYRDMRVSGIDTTIVTDGHYSHRGRLRITAVVILNGNGTVNIQPRTDPGASATTSFVLMSGRTTFANSQFDITPLKMVIGKHAHVEFGPVAIQPLLSLVDLRKQHP